MKKGFTLIELLVVVLIIGILAGVALPQYTTVVDKARFSTIMSLARTIKNEQEVFYLANGFYSTDLNQLAPSLPDGWTINETGSGASSDTQSLSISNRRYVAAKSGVGIRNSLVIYYDNTPYPNRIDCYAYTGTLFEREKRLCKALGGVEDPSVGNCEGGCTIYRLQ